MSEVEYTINKVETKKMSRVVVDLDEGTAIVEGNTVDLDEATHDALKKFVESTLSGRSDITAITVDSYSKVSSVIEEKRARPIGDTGVGNL
ncbi:MAG: hypothetical protein GF334_02940 [Candidatus Altiarchaeales archaeon]|nr:hypothetical protein [Candidatus Altiarchaeales archaeon]